MGFIRSFLLLVFIVVYCSADVENVPPMPDFPNLQGYLEFLKNMSNDSNVASFLQESKPEIEIYDHVKAVMEQYAIEYGSEENSPKIKYSSSVIVDQPNQPRSVTVYLEKDGEKLSCGLNIAPTQTFTNFEDFALECIGGLQFRRIKPG